ncbi:nuclear pore complex component-domain-containing protein [Tirmania nivea]|nr:nuclear pore complex component-domain-containing protein [Tirmania nivea]
MSTASIPRTPTAGSSSSTSTPKPGAPTPTAFKPTPGSGSTGSWRHPAMDTIVQRQRRQKGLADIHSSRLARNGGALVATFVFTWLLHTWLLRRSPAYGKQPERHPVWDDIMWLGGYILNALRIVFLYNIGESTYRLLRPEPDFSDLPLSPIQRQLLGLDPKVDSRAAAPGGYITPPRYARSSPSSPSTTIGGSPRPRSPGPSSSSLPSSSPFSPFSLFSPYSNSSPRPTSFSSATDGPMTPPALKSTVRGGTMAQSLGFSVHTSMASSQNSISSPSPKNRTGQGLGLGYGNASAAVGPSGLPVGNRFVYEKMGERGEELRWIPRNSIFSPLKGQMN